MTWEEQFIQYKINFGFKTRHSDTKLVKPFKKAWEAGISKVNIRNGLMTRGIIPFKGVCGHLVHLGIGI